MRVFDKMLDLGIKSLKRVELTQSALFVAQLVEPLQISSFIANFKSSLQAVHLDGKFNTQTYKILLNEMPNLKDLLLVPHLSADQLADLNTLNHTVETYFLKLPTSGATFSPCFTKFSNVKLLYINQNESTSEIWQSIIENMTKLHTVHLMDSISNISIFKRNSFPNVKTLFLFKTCSSEAHWKIVAEFFPNIETLKIFNFHQKNNLDVIPRSWKTLKHVELGEGLRAPVASFIKLLRDFPKITSVVVSPNAFIWNMIEMMSDRDVVKEFIQNGLRLLSLDAEKIKKISFACPSLELFKQTYSFSSGCEIKL